MAETYYDVLGVPPDASRDEIESAYRERVLETHPDHNDDPDATEAFKRVTDAEEVLTDETARARYDRLGHDAYARFTERFGAAGTPGNEAGGSTVDEREAGSTSRGAGSTTRNAYAGTYSGGTTEGSAGSTTAGRSAGGPRGRSRERGDGTASGSHHARQRARRQRADRGRAASRRSGRRRTEGHETRGDRSRRDRIREDRGRQDRSGSTQTTVDSGDEDHEAGADSFRYSVHEWDEDEVSVEDERPSIGHHTAVFLSCLTLLYPVFVYSSVTAAFPPVVNAIVAACTLCLIGYLLTMPRIAVVAFGAWSLLVPVATWRIDALEVTPVTAAVTVGGFWIPFGYALVVRRVLRP